MADATARGLRLISYDRPGYGESTPQPGRTMADAAADARAICAALGLGRLAMWGLSGGGPPLLACAALLPDLVAAAACLASPAPYDAAGLDWLAGMGSGAATDVTLMLTDRATCRRDEAVPFSHGQWLAAHIPGVQARLFDDEGHGTLRENRIGEVHAWLADRL